MLDDDLPDDDPSPFADPLHPDDRLWRHPSELRSVPPAGSRSIPDAVTFAPPVPRRRLAWSALLASSLVGASAALLAVLATGMGERVVERIVEPPPSSEPDAMLPVSTTAPVGPAEAVTAAMPGVAHLTVATGDATVEASALVVRSDGYLVTDAVNVEGATSLLVTLADGTSHAGTVVAVDVVSELAVIQVEADGLPMVEFGDPAELQVGQWAMVLGSHEDGGPSVGSGSVSALEQRSTSTRGTPLYGLIRVDAPVPSEVAGGPLVTDTGSVVGLTIRSDDGPFGWATPIDEVRDVADDLIEVGHARHAWLGIEGSRTADGPVVSVVVAGSPAEVAGVEVGDVLLHADGRPLASMATLAAMIRDLEPGDSISITYERDGVEWTCVAVLGQRT